MRHLFTLNREEITALMDAGYGDYIYRAALVAPLLSLAGILSVYFFPASAERLIAYFIGSLGGSGLENITLDSMSSLPTLVLLFMNNLSASFSSLFWGLVPFLYLTAFTLGINFYLLGVFVATAAESGVGLLTYLVSIIPHGILELPAIILFSSLGLFFCNVVTDRIRGRTKAKILSVFAICVRFIWTVIAPLLFVAALAETFLTPFLLKLIL